MYRVVALSSLAFAAQCFAKDLDVVVSIVGALFGLPINCIFPSLIYLASSQTITRTALVDVGVISLTVFFISICLMGTLDT